MGAKVVLVDGGQPTAELDSFLRTGDSPDLEPYALKGQVDIDDGTNVPASAGATGTTGTVVVSADAIYVCVDTDTWVKTDLATWA